ncbi:hypothetical protein LOZ66_003459 [Ophidiomyces ophidiicola]|nr:hypothetical protein LOZ66_003459 [Ophidiomyces ophidiicola]
MRPFNRYFTRPLPKSLCLKAVHSYSTPLYQATFASACAPLSRMVSPGLTSQGESGTRYRLVRPLGTQIRGKWPNVWLAADDSNNAIKYVTKGPPHDDSDAGESPSAALLAFKHELEMQRLFKNDPMIRRLVDYIPDLEPGGPMMVLEAFTNSLWDARNSRPFTAKEIKWIMKGVL